MADTPVRFTLPNGYITTQIQVSADLGGGEWSEWAPLDENLPQYFSVTWAHRFRVVWVHQTIEQEALKALTNEHSSTATDTGLAQPRRRASRLLRRIRVLCRSHR